MVYLSLFACTSIHRVMTTCNNCLLNHVCKNEGKYILFYSILFCRCCRYHGWTMTTHQLRTPTLPPLRLTYQVRPRWGPESIKKGPDFLAVEWIGSSQTPPPHSRQQIVSLTQSSCVSLGELTDGRGGGWGRIQIIRRRKSMFLNKSLNTLFIGLSNLTMRYILSSNEDSHSTKMIWGNKTMRYKWGEKQRLQLVTI